MSAEPVPVAWLNVADGTGNIRCWTRTYADSLRLAKEVGSPLEPLYDRATLDAAVAAARAEERAAWQQDAERYQWLKGHATGHDMEGDGSNAARLWWTRPDGREVMSVARDLEGVIACAQEEAAAIRDLKPEGE